MTKPYERARNRKVKTKACGETGLAGATPKSPASGTAVAKVAATRSKAEQTANAKRALAYRPSRGVDEYVRRVSEATPMELIQLERSGVSGRFLKDLAIRIGVPAIQVYRILGAPRSTVERCAAEGRDISGVAGQAAVGMAKLLGKAQAMVSRSTSPDARGFDVGKWFGQWIECPAAALGGRKPAEFIATPTGMEVVARLLGAIESGAYQ